MPQRPRVPPPSAAYAPAAPTVLVVEDDARTRDLLVGLLDEEGYTAVGAEHGQAALDYLHTNPPAVLYVVEFIYAGPRWVAVL